MTLIRIISNQSFIQNSFLNPSHYVPNGTRSPKEEIRAESLFTFFGYDSSL
jgi:hypothetical protein